jgi:tetratricopeptide (TPR) repeat protein
MLMTLSVVMVAALSAAAPQAPADLAEYQRASQHYLDGLTIEDPAQQAAKKRHFEEAERLLVRIAERRGEYRPIALGKLLMVYDTDALNRPVDRAAVARQYLAIEPRSMIGHVSLASALRAAGKDAEAWAALDAACGAVTPDDAPALARAILLQLTDTFPLIVPGAPPAPSPPVPASLGRLLDYADQALDRELAADASDRGAILAKTAALTLRGQRLERDPARRKALAAEADAMLARLRTGAPRAEAPKPAADAPPAIPDGYHDEVDKATALVGQKRFADAAAIYDRVIATHPAFAPAHYQRVDVLIRSGQRAAAEAGLRAARKTLPATFDARYTGAVYIEEMVRKNATIGTAEAAVALGEALSLVDEALTLKPNDFTAMVYKSLVVRGQARFATDPAAAKRLTAEADRLLAAAKAAQPKP